MRTVELPAYIQAEQARFIHRTVPTAALGSMVVVGLVWFVFHNVVPRLDLNAWVGAFAVLTLWRMIVWWRNRVADFAVQGCAWLRHAVLAAFIGGVLWGLGSLFLFPPGLLVYQLTFMVTLAMMATAAMFSYSPHYRTYFAYFTLSMVPGIIALELQREPPQEALGVGLLLLCCVVRNSVRTYNRMFLESLALRLEKIDLVSQLTAQKDVAEAANLASRVLAAASDDLRQPVHALNLYLGAFSQMELPTPAGVMLGKVRQCAQIMDEMFLYADISELDAGAIKPQVGAFSLAPLFARARVEFEPQARAKGIELSETLLTAFAQRSGVGGARAPQSHFQRNSLHRAGAGLLGGPAARERPSHLRL